MKLCQTEKFGVYLSFGYWVMQVQQKEAEAEAEAEELMILIISNILP